MSLTDITIRNAKHYTYLVIWPEDDQEFVGLCAEFPSLSWLADDQEEALRGITGEKRLFTSPCCTA